nr:hypothetical protein [Micromonospora purpureochromogenes]
MAALLTVGGCADAGPSDGRQTPQPPVSAPAQDARGSAEEAALAAYRGMWQAYAKAGLTANPDEPDLARFASGNALKTLKNGLASYRSKGQVLKGEYALNPQAAQVSLASASATVTVTVTDCIDDTKFLVYKTSGEPINDVPGGRRAARATVTDLGAEGWKVASFGVQGPGTC